MRNPIAWALLSFAFAAGPGGDARAAADFDSCDHIVDALPATLDAPGQWCLTQDFTYSAADGGGIAIYISVNHVTLDCNGRRIQGIDHEAAPPALGILAYGNNVTVRNCDIAHFDLPMDIRGKAVVVEDNVITDAYSRGLYLAGENAIARRNHVRGVRGENLVGWAFGISAFGSVDVIDNTVSDIRAGEGSDERAWGIFLNWDSDQSQTQFVVGNRVRDVVADGTGEAAGIQNSAPGDSVVRGNVVVVPDAEYGIYCYYFDNHRVSENAVFGGTEAGIANCEESSGNVVKN